MCVRVCAVREQPGLGGRQIPWARRPPAHSAEGRGGSGVSSAGMGTCHCWLLGTWDLPTPEEGDNEMVLKDREVS